MSVRTWSRLTCGAVPSAASTWWRSRTPTRTTSAMLEAVHPSFAIVSAGFENSYGHPHPDVLGRLAERGISVLRTDALGLVSIRTDGRGISVTTSHWEPHPTIAAVFDR